MKNILNKILVAGAIVAMSAPTANAQRWDLQASGFYNHQNFSDDWRSGGFSVGLGYNQYLNDNWSINVEPSYAYNYALYVETPVGGSYNTKDMEEDPFLFKYSSNFFIERNKWHVLQVPLTVQYETSSKTRWYGRTGALANVMLTAGKSEYSLGRLRTSGYYDQYDATLDAPLFAGFGDFGYTHDEKALNFKTNFNWILETGVKQMINKSQTQSIYIGVFANIALTDLRPDATNYESDMVGYTKNVKQPLEVYNVWEQDNLKDRKLQNWSLGLRFRYSFGK